VKQSKEVKVRRSSLFNNEELSHDDGNNKSIKGTPEITEKDFNNNAPAILLSDDNVVSKHIPINDTTVSSVHTEQQEILPTEEANEAKMAIQSRKASVKLGVAPTKIALAPELQKSRKVSRIRSAHGNRMTRKVLTSSPKKRSLASKKIEEKFDI